MKRYLAILLSCLVFAVSCIREPIIYTVSNYYINIEPELVEGGTVPSIYSVNFYDVAEGRLVYQTFVHSHNHPEGMPEGGYLSGLQAGDYTMVVYNYDTFNSRVNNKNNLAKIFADTDTYDYSNALPVIKMPDHLYLYSGRVSIPYLSEEDDVHVIKVNPFTILEDFRIRVFGIRNTSLIERVNFYVSGQARGAWLAPDAGLVDGNAIIAWSPEKIELDGEGALISSYTTFGRNICGDRLMFTVYISGPGGTTFWAQQDISDAFEEAVASGSHVIDVKVDLEVTERQQGGFDPSAEEWDSNYYPIDL